MTMPDRAHAYPPVSHPAPEQKHVFDYLRVVYRRRWIALPVFLAVFVVGAVNAFRETPVYQARAQLLIQKDAPSVARLDQVFQAENSWYDSDFYQTQLRLLQSGPLARRGIDDLHLWSPPKLGNGPEPKASISLSALLWRGTSSLIDLIQKPFATQPPPALVADEATPE